MTDAMGIAGLREHSLSLAIKCMREQKPLNASPLACANMRVLGCRFFVLFVVN